MFLFSEIIFQVKYSYINVLPHVFASPLSPGVVLIVKSCGTNVSENVNRITIKFSTIS